jgi:hypothetical protein
MVSSDTRQFGGSLVPAWIASGLLLCAAVLVPWAAILFITLPRHYGANHWQLAWGGFDVGLGIALGNTAIAALHRSPRGEVAAAVTGTLLICDAWFDVLTSHGPADVAKAVGEAALIELPLAALCFWIVRSARRRGEQRSGASQLTVAMDRHPGVGIEEVRPFRIDDQAQGLAFASLGLGTDSRDEDRALAFVPDFGCRDRR